MYLADLKSTGKDTIATIAKSLTDAIICMIRISLSTSAPW